MKISKGVDPRASRDTRKRDQPTEPISSIYFRWCKVYGRRVQRYGFSISRHDACAKEKGCFVADARILKGKKIGFLVDAMLA